MEIYVFCDLKKIMRDRKLTLTELSLKTGINCGSLSRIRKSGSINFSTLQKLANGLQIVDITELISLEIKQKQ